MTTTAPNVAPAPGTALPWRQAELVKRNVLGPDRMIARCYNDSVAVKDAAYIVHAANAYPALAAENARLIALVGDMDGALCQYINDMHYPPAADSRSRRVEMINRIRALASKAAVA